MFQRTFIIALSFVGLSLSLHAQENVSAEKMQEVYEQVRTPYKYGLVIAPKNDSFKVDCPTVFRKGSDWYMSYISFDGRGYQTLLAKSSDLLHWTTIDTMLSFDEDSSWDAAQKAGYLSFIDPQWGGSYAIKKQKGKYWMSYFGGKEKGYEAGLLSIGMAYSKKHPAKKSAWKTFPAPVLSATDANARWWENKKLFKSTVIEDKDRKTGYRYIMYYNANGDTARDNKKTRWYERIGMAVSNDLKHWERNPIEPVVHHPAGITGDPHLQKMGDLWVMFYFGAFWNDRQGAFNRFACSYDLVHWTDWTGDNLLQSSEDFDKRYAHKSCVIRHNGVVYHFYNAVNEKEKRGIAVATSADLGKSDLHFSMQ